MDSFRDNEAAVAERQPWSLADAACLCVLLIAGIVVRLDSLSRVTPGVDEAQYVTRGTFFSIEDEPVLSTPYGPLYTFVVARWFADLFGPYPMFEFRVMIGVFSLMILTLIYVTVRRTAGTVPAFLAGFFYVHTSCWYGGIFVNREWFVNPLLLLANLLVLWSLDVGGKRQKGLLFAAGLLCGLALWFKQHALPLVLPIPMYFICQAIYDRRFWSPFLNAGAYAVGGIIAVALYWVPLLAEGSAAEKFFSLTRFTQNYVVGNEGRPSLEKVTNPLSTFELYYYFLFRALPRSANLVLPYVLAGLVLAAAFVRCVGGPQFKRTASLDNPATLLFTFHFVMALVAIQTGKRFFLYYYNFLMPPAAVLFGLSFHYLLKWKDSLTSRTFLWLVCYELVLCELWDSLTPLVGRKHGSLVIVTLAAAGLFMAYVITASPDGTRPQRLIRGLFAFLVTFTIGRTAVTTYIVPDDYNCRLPGLEYLIDYIRENHEPGDRLFVWGWRSELYIETKLPPASRFAMCSYVVNDTQASRPTPQFHEPITNLLMNDLRNHPPRFIIDASEKSITLSKRKIYDLDKFEPLHEYVKQHYEKVARIVDCDVYIRRPAENVTKSSQ